MYYFIVRVSSGCGEVKTGTVVEESASGRTDTFTLAAGQTDLSLDQGVFVPTSLDVIAEPLMDEMIFLPLMQY